MSEVEKQESQKTVVAFITGLLIGGLLVWVFSSTPEGSKDVELTTDDAKTTETTKTTTETNTTTPTTETPATKTAVGEGKIAVTDQKSGMKVALGDVTLPAKSGWVVVRDYLDGVPGNILGAARYSVDEGLMPKSVDLMRATTVGSSYQVVFFTNEGGIEFRLGEDKLVDGIATTFKAN